MAKLKQCKVCGAEMASSAKACPNCGAKNKKSILKRWWFWVLVIVIVLGGIIGGSGGGSSGSKEYESLTKEEYMSKCETFKYEDVARNPDQYKGKLVTFKGEVIQVSEGSTLTMRITQDNPDDKYALDTWYVTYKPPQGASRILENDKVIVYGECTGVTSYTSILKQKVTIPSMILKYIENQ